MRWYITVAAVHEFQSLVGWPRVDEGPGFDDAARWLDRVVESATMQRDEGHRQIWRAKTTVDGRVVRLELYVATGQRTEGDLPQLVRVRSKGGNRQGPKGNRR